MSDNKEQDIPLGLYWKDKRTTVERIVLPFQSLEVIETINESRVTREKEKGTMFRQDPNAMDVEWRNKLIWGDNKYVMSALLEKYAGKIDLIYIDPPFATGANFSTTVTIGDNEVEHTKEASAMEELAYRDTWGLGLDSFLQMMYDRIVLVRELLSEKGTLYLHCDYRVNSHLRIILDEVFGSENYFSEIIWQRSTTVGSSKAIANRYPTLCDHILVYTKSKGKNTFIKQYTPPTEDYKARFKDKDKNGYYYWNTLATYSQETYDRLELEDKVRWTKGAKYPQYKTYLTASMPTGEYKVYAIDNVSGLRTSIIKFVVVNPAQPKLWIVKPAMNDSYLANTLFQVRWGDFIKKSQTINSTGFIQKLYKIALSDDDGSSWHSESVVSVNNAIPGANNNNFSNTLGITTPGTYKIKITDYDNSANFAISEAFNIVTSLSSGFTYTYNWDKSFPLPPNKPNPDGLAADGTCRILIKLKKQPANTKQISSVSATIVPVGDTYTGTDLLGKIMYAFNPDSYTLEANAANAISTSGLPFTTFWLVAPDDFSHNPDDQRVSRKINVEFVIRYTDNTTETITTAQKPIEIVRPALFFVHGLNGDATTFENIRYYNSTLDLEVYFDKPGPLIPLWKQINRVNLIGNASFRTNAEILLGINTNGVNYNSFQYTLKEMHNAGYANNRVDYVSHSMGGCVGRTIINQYPIQYAPTSGLYKNYNKGFIYKFITVNTPHNGALLADLTVDRYRSSIAITLIKNLNKEIKSFFVNGEPAPAILDLQAFHGGIRFKQTNIKNHLIGSDLDEFDNESENTILKSNPKYDLLYYFLLPTGSSVQQFFSSRYFDYEYLNNSDIVVPVSSQLPDKYGFEISKLNDDTYAQTNSSILYGLTKMHVGISSDIKIGSRIFHLLNSPINSSFFSDNIPPNYNSDGTLYRPLSGEHLEDSVFNYFDSSFLKIEYPLRNQTVFIDSSLKVNVILNDTANLKVINLAFQGEFFQSGSKAANQAFNVKVNSAFIGQNLLIVQAIYDSLGYSITYSDTVTLNVESLDSLQGFYIFPKTQKLNRKQNFELESNAVYKSSISTLNSDVDSLSFIIADTNVVSFDPSSLQFVSKDTGTTYIAFNYKGFNDTAYVYISSPVDEGVVKACLSSTISLFSGFLDSSKTYQWQIDSTGSFENINADLPYSGIDSPTLVLNNINSALYNYKYRCIISDSVSQTVSKEFTLKFVTTWTGSSDTVWENPDNWSCNTIPDANTDVIISESASNFPIVNSNVYCRSLTIQKDATVFVNTGFEIHITGKSE